MKHKEEDLKNKVRYFSRGIVAIPETHFKSKGKFKLQDYQIFESIRKNKDNGGSMHGIHVALHPVLVSEYCEHFELIVAEIEVANKNIRVITGYRPQENWEDKDRLPFFTALEKEVASAQLEGKAVIIAMDANSK